MIVNKDEEIAPVNILFVSHTETPAYDDLQVSAFLLNE